MNKTLDPIEVRVQRSLQTIGFPGITVFQVGNGTIVLRGSVESPAERAMLYSAARAVIGVRDVSNELTTLSRHA